MKKWNQWIAAALALALLATPVLAANGNVEKALDYLDIKITVDGEEITPTDVNGNPTEPFAMDGSVYVPIRAIAQALGCEVNWDSETNTVTISSPAEAKFQEASAIEWAANAPKNGSGVNAWNEGENAKKVALMIEAAELGSLDAMSQLVDIFLYGKQNFKVDFSIVKTWAEAAIKAGSTDATMYLALGRVHSDNSAWSNYNTLEEYIDYELALECLQKSAAGFFKNNRYIAYLFYYDEITGLPAEEGDATAKDTGVKYMLRAADNGDATANAEVGTWYLSGNLTGTGDRTPAELAIFYFERAVENSNSHGTPPGVKDSLITLADIYENGAQSSYLDGVEGGDKIEVSLADALRILEIMCGESYYGDEFAEDLARVQGAMGG